jgi:hypothetical protein
MEKFDQFFFGEKGVFFQKKIFKKIFFKRKKKKRKERKLVSPFGNFLPQNKRLGIATGHMHSLKGQMGDERATSPFAIAEAPGHGWWGLLAAKVAATTP